jgi:hypothetical protein
VLINFAQPGISPSFMSSAAPSTGRRRAALFSHQEMGQLDPSFLNDSRTFRFAVERTPMLSFHNREENDTALEFWMETFCARMQNRLYSHERVMEATLPDLRARGSDFRVSAEIFMR